MDEHIFNRPALKPMHKLRTLDPRKYYELCTTHLSYLVNDIPVDALNVNQFLKATEIKSEGFHGSKKVPRYGVMAGAPLTQEGICRVYQLIEFIAREENICQKNLFRRPGNQRRQHQLSLMLNSGISLDIDSETLNVYDCCEVMKRFLGELGEPLLMSNLYEIHCELASMSHTQSHFTSSCSQKTRARTKQLNAARILLLLLPVESYLLLYSVLTLLAKVAEVEENLMNAESLSIIFTPHMLLPWKRNDISIPETLDAASESLTFLIKNASVLFEPPPQLLIDVHAHLQHLEGDLDYTPKPSVMFCHSGRTPDEEYTKSQVHELLADMQAIPHCPEKKRFFKRLKQENNQLTPTSLNVTDSGHHSRSSSVSSSIKKYFGQSLRKKAIRKTSSCDRLSTDKMNKTTPIRLHLFRKRSTHEKRNE